MEYYNDIIVNFDETLYYFYEWEKEDVECIKKIPLFKVTKKVFKDIISNKIKLKKETYDLIKNKMIFTNNKKGVGCILCDGENCIVLEFVKDKEVAISSLELKDELEIIEMSYSLKKEEFGYTSISKRKYNDISRKDTLIKSYLNVWIDELFNSNNIERINYYYREWFKKKLDNKKKAYKEMKEDLKELKDIHYYIYDLAMVEHKKSGLSN